MTNYNTPFDIQQQPDYTHCNTTFSDPAILSEVKGTNMLNIESYDKTSVMPLRFKISKQVPDPNNQTTASFKKNYDQMDRTYVSYSKQSDIFSMSQKNINTDLMRDVINLIRPGGGLQVMEPANSIANANSSNPGADPVF